MATTTTKEILKGGEFLIRESDAERVFIPEELTEEQKMFADMAMQFLKDEVLPKVEEIEKQNFDVTLDLMDKAADLGLLGASLPLLRLLLSLFPFWGGLLHPVFFEEVLYAHFRLGRVV